MKLLSGPGSETSGACWMSALHFYTRKDTSWTDQAPWACVSPAVRRLCIGLNDALPGGERERRIGPHLFAPLGTATGPEDERTRAFMAADFAVRVAVPVALRARGRNDLAASLEGLPPVVDKVSAKAAQNAAADAAAVAAAVTYAASAVAYAVAYADASASAASASASAAAFAQAADRSRLFDAWLDLILRCCAVGQKTEVAPTQPRCRVERMLECGSVEKLVAAEKAGTGTAVNS